MEIFGNPVRPSVVRSAIRRREAYARRFHFDPAAVYPLSYRPEPCLKDLVDLDVLTLDPKQIEPAPVSAESSVLIATLRMGYGHYRIALAMASAARALGLRPLWLDLLSLPGTPGAGVIEHLESLYNLGCRLSRTIPLFDRFYWEPLTSKGFRALDYNARDRELCRLMAPVFRGLAPELPVVCTHSWAAQAALHAGMHHVVNAIPDNWPLALHLAEGAVHTVQSPSAYLGYRLLKDMGRPGQTLRPMPASSLRLTGHYVDHELVHHLEDDSAARFRRIDSGAPRRLLISIGGAGVQAEITIAILRHCAPLFREGRAVLFLNTGHHPRVRDEISEVLERAGLEFTLHTDWNETRDFAEAALRQEVRGIHLFHHEQTFPAVYTTNLLMRASDLLLTKPSELAFYPIPKLFLRRVGGHEAWGAIRSGEIGDGTVECRTLPEVLSTLDLLLREDDLLRGYLDAILRLAATGRYRGAYEAVELAHRRTSP